MIGETVRAVRLLRSDSTVETVVALALLAGVALAFLKEQR